MDTKDIDKTLIYINTSNVTYNSDTYHDFTVHFVEDIKEVLFIKLMKSEVIINPSADINSTAIIDTDPVYITLNDYKRYMTNINGNSYHYFDLINLNITEKFGATSPPNMNISFKNDFISSACSNTDTTIYTLKTVEPKLTKLNITLRDKNNNLLLRSEIKQFNMILCIYNDNKKNTMR